MFASPLSSLKRAFSSIDSLKPFNTYKKKKEKNPKLPNSILQIIVYPSLDITRKYSYCNKCNSLLNSLFVCEELLLIMTFCNYILQRTLLHLQYPPNYIWRTWSVVQATNTSESCRTSVDCRAMLSQPMLSLAKQTDDPQDSIIVCM